MNNGNSDYDNKYHGTEGTNDFPTSPSNFVRGAFMLMHISGDQLAEDCSEWKFDTTH